MPFTIQSILNTPPGTPRVPDVPAAAGTPASTTATPPAGLTQSRISNAGSGPRNATLLPDAATPLAPAGPIAPAAPVAPTAHVGPLTIGYVTLVQPDNIQAALANQDSVPSRQRSSQISAYNKFLERLEEGRMTVPGTNEVVRRISRFRELPIDVRQAMLQAAQTAGVLTQPVRTTVNRVEGLSRTNHSTPRIRLANPVNNAALSLLDHMTGLRMNDYRFYRGFMKRMEDHGVGLHEAPHRIRDINQFRALPVADRELILKRLEYDRALQGGTRVAVLRVEQLIREQQTRGAAATTAENS
jgi:hypothetical protein